MYLIPKFHDSITSCKKNFKCKKSQNSSCWWNNFRSFSSNKIVAATRENFWKSRTSYRNRNNLIKSNKYSHLFRIGRIHSGIDMILTPKNGYPTKIPASCLLYWTDKDNRKNTILRWGLDIISVKISESNQYPRYINKRQKLNPSIRKIC